MPHLPKGQRLRVSPHVLFMERTCNSPTRFPEAMASRNAAFMGSHLSPTWARGSKGGDDRASGSRGKSQAGSLGVQGGRCRKAPLIKRDTDLWHPAMAPSTRTCRAEIAAT
ncbi:hypothetical protein CesoFtcFv8_020584 [Champsocephalus esox]|uniref:Uncharacterized protein n=1 Tax=Champsocephalus esox TaxID=159716 RepID=A0AAN8GLB7_9TELE|nr:hypothetical protein CesoFtcFv8_020584 [Champsocephalus esox]